MKGTAQQAGRSGARKESAQGIGPNCRIRLSPGSNQETFSICETGNLRWKGSCGLDLKGDYLGREDERERRIGWPQLSKVEHLILNTVPEVNMVSQSGNFTPQTGTLRL